MTKADGYELLDCGSGRRLERFGSEIVDRPHPAADMGPLDPRSWAMATLRFDAATGWLGATERIAAPALPDGPPAHATPWLLEAAGVRLELRPGPGGELGVFPDHLAHTTWLRERVAERGVRAAAPEVLHLFGHTGLATLVAAAAGARVTHVDASRPAVLRARRNADLSGLADRPIRWIVDDAAGYVRRETRRGRRYEVIVLDPPTYGHGPGGTAWRIGVDLRPLLDAVSAIAADGAAILLTSHSQGSGPDDLGSALAAAFGRRPGRVATGPLDIVASSTARLRLGAFARMDG